MGRRYRVGKRRYTAIFESHNGRRDEYGQPTYKVDDDWETVVRWPCEVMQVSGGESFRGRQVSAGATYTLYGDYSAVRNVNTKMRIRVNGLVLGIVTGPQDVDGDRFEAVFDARVSE